MAKGIKWFGQHNKKNCLAVGFGWSDYNDKCLKKGIIVFWGYNIVLEIFWKTVFKK